jgi:hypothetical protein
MASINTVNPSAFNPSVLLGAGGVGGGMMGGNMNKIDNKRRSKGGMLLVNVHLSLSLKW